jgi:hypothetical protein
MTEKITRKEKINCLAQLYIDKISAGTINGDIHSWTILNQIIIDSVGVTGLKEIKTLAYKLQ